MEEGHISLNAVECNQRHSIQFTSEDEECVESSTTTACRKAETADHEDSNNNPMEASIALRLKCFIYVLVLIALGFITTFVETRAFFERRSSAGSRKFERLPIEWVCYGIKCAFVLPAIGALVFLQYCAVAPGKLSEAQLQQCNAKGSNPIPSGVIVLRNIDRFVYLPKVLSKSPSKMFLIMSLLFAFFSCLSFLIEIACGVIEAAQQGTSFAAEISEVIRRSLLIVFIAVQTRFFFFNDRVCIQWRMSLVWLAASHILACNVTAWIINVGFELREVINITENELEVDIFCERTSIYSSVRALYPFIVEYYVMSALLTFALVLNTGRLAVAIRRIPISELSARRVRDLLRPPRKAVSREQEELNMRFEFSTWKQFSGTIGVGVFLLLLTLTVSVFVRSYGKEHFSSQLTFCITLLLLYSCGIVSVARLLRMLQSRRTSTELSNIHRTDRILLWIGAAAITVNDAYTFWISWSHLTGNGDVALDAEQRVIYALTAMTAMVNIWQSLMQGYALECTLVHTFPAAAGGTQVLHGRALLTFLMLLNAAEWLINTICFNFFFFARHQHEEAVALSLLAMPLQVFYRFHSIACIHDFKKHCGDDEPPQGKDGREQQCVEIDFGIYE